VDVADAPDGFTILGSGKTALDACTWLLDNGVDPDRIRWVRPRDAWLTPRAVFQPLDLIGGSVEYLGRAVAALAQATDVDDLFHRLEEDGQQVRLDPGVWPSMYKGPMVSDPELAGLRSVERVVRLGRVQAIGTDSNVLDRGEIPTTPGELHVDCTAAAFRSVAPRTSFEPGRITPQSLMGGFVSFNAALVGYVEATRDSDEEKNRLCPAERLPDTPADWIRAYRGGVSANLTHGAEPDLSAWIDRSRLNTFRGMSAHATDPGVVAGLTQMLEHVGPALANADRLLAAELASSP
jgi:hypothetical protein